MASRGFYLACLLLGCLGFLCILLITYWTRHWHGYFAWDGSLHMFNWHPVLMVSGMVVLYGVGEWGSWGTGHGHLVRARLGLYWQLLHAAGFQGASGKGMGISVLGAGVSKHC